MNRPLIDLSTPANEARFAAVHAFLRERYGRLLNGETWHVVERNHPEMLPALCGHPCPDSDLEALR